MERREGRGTCKRNYEGGREREGGRGNDSSQIFLEIGNYYSGICSRRKLFLAVCVFALVEKMHCILADWNLAAMTFFVMKKNCKKDFVVGCFTICHIARQKKVLLPGMVAPSYKPSTGACVVWMDTLLNMLGSNQARSLR